MVRYIVIFLALMVMPLAARATQCNVPQTFVTGEVLTAAVLNANPVALAACINGGIDNSNIGPAGIYASQIVPTTTAQATFGGGLSYTFPVGISGPLIITGSTTLTFGTGGASLNYNVSSPNAYCFLNGNSTATAACITAAGVLSTVGSQTCGLPAGYHVECGTNTCTITDSANRWDSCGSTSSFNKAFGSTPKCSVGLKSGSTAQGSVVASTDSGTTNVNGVGINVYLVQSLTGANLTVDWTCVGV